jgi:hypothetical protein
MRLTKTRIFVVATMFSVWQIWLMGARISIPKVITLERKPWAKRQSSAIPSNTAAFASGSIPKHGEISDLDGLVHPVLLTRIGQGLDGHALDSSAYKKLSNYTDRPMSPALLTKYFGKAETEAAFEFCKAVIGSSKDNVERLAGAPYYKGKPPLKHSFTRPGEELWMYQFGYTGQTIKVIFKTDRCREAKVCTENEKDDFNHCRVIELCQYAPGKTVAQIDKHEGAPITWSTDENYFSPPGSDEDKTRTFVYHFGQSEAVKLTMRYGFCAEANILQPCTNPY